MAQPEAPPHHAVLTARSDRGRAGRGQPNTRDLPGTPDGFHQLDYTSFGLPSKIISGEDVSAKTTYFEYGAGKERIVRRTPTHNVYYAGELYQGSQPVDGSPTEHRYRVFAGGSQIAELVRGPNGSQTWSLHHDLLGSVTTVSDASSTFQRHFDPFGSVRSGEVPGPSGVRAGFTGHEHDAELDLINMRGRIYDPTYARFLTADPITQTPTWSQGLNRFAYVFNDPLNYVDPSGFQADDSTWWGLGLVAGAVGGGVAYNLFATPAAAGAAAGASAAGGATIYTAGSSLTTAAAAQALGNAAGAAVIAVNTLSLLSSPPSTMAGVQATNTASPAMTTGTGDATGQHRAGVLGQEAPQMTMLGQTRTYQLGQCGVPGAPRCGAARPYGSDPMDRIVEQFLNARSEDPVYGTVADSMLGLSGPEHGAPIIRGRDGSLRLGELSVSRTDYSTVTIRFPRLPAGEQYVGTIHGHPGATPGLHLGHSADVDVPSVRALPRTLGTRSFRSYVVAAGSGPYFGVHTFEPLPAPGTFIPLTP